MSQNHIYHSWILEFLVQQPIEDKLLDLLLSVLPLPNHDSRVPKLLLLRKLQSNVCHGISENILDFLEKIYQLDQSSGLLDCSEFLRKAYCDVAVECSVRCLRSSGNDVKGEFFEVVKRLWRGRVRKMEGGNVGLVSKELLEWRDEIEAAVWEEDVCLRVVERGKEVDGVEAVMVYLEDEKSRMGPSFLEVVSKTLGALRKRDGGDRCGISDVEDSGFDRCDKRKTVVVDKEEGDSVTERMGTSFLELVSENLGTLRKRDGGGRCGTSDVENHGFGNGDKICDKGKSVVVDGGKGNSVTERMGTSSLELVSETLGTLRKRDGGDRCGTSDVEDPGFGNSDKRCDKGKGEGNTVTKRMGTSSLELVSETFGTLRNRDGGDRCGTSDVEDPGFGNEEKAYDKGKSVVVDGGKGNSRRKRKRAAYKHARPITSRSCGGVKIVDVEEENVEKAQSDDDSLCVENSNDSIDRSSMEPRDPSSFTPQSPHLASRKCQLPSYMLTERNPRPPRNRRWSSVEEDTLRAGVGRFGEGNWKQILDEYSEIFSRRSCVDLKDKWRNMTRPHR